MKDDIMNLKGEWDRAKKDDQSSKMSVAEIIRHSKERMKNTKAMHIKNIAILVITLVLISLFFINVAPMKELVSRIGIALMLGGLVVRIAIELYSINKSSKIDLGDTTLSTNKSYLEFYEFRKKIHQPVTITIVALYTTGFYMLTPEFMKYLSIDMVLLMDVSYLVIAVVIGYFIRKAIREEMGYLHELLSLHKEMSAKN